MRALRHQHWARWGRLHVTALDLELGERAKEPGLADELLTGDFLEHSTRYDLIVGNPPYRHVERHLRRALELAPNVGYLLRLSVLESRSRQAFWEKYPPLRVDVLPSRPRFVGTGTDTSAYAWITWSRPHHAGWSRLGWLS